MTVLLKFLIFLVYIILIFCVKSYIVLGVLISFNIILMKLLKKSVINFFRTSILLIPFLMITFIFNLVWSSFNESILIVERLILAYTITYIFSKMIYVSEIVYFIESLIKPLKIFNVNYKKIGMIAGIAISMLPILKNEIDQKTLALKSKGYKFKINNLGLVFKPIFISILKRTGEIEKSLIAKGYEE